LGFVGDDDSNDAWMMPSADARASGREVLDALATVAHELRTPLSAVLGWASLLRNAKTMDPDLLARGLETIDRNARAQARIVEDLLDLARMGQGKLVLEAKLVDLRLLVLQALDTIGPTAADRSITLALQGTSHPCLVKGDPERLRQVLGNLLTNALKFTPSGRIDVELEADPARTDIAVVVRDSGIGIAPDDLARVFDRFRRLDGTAGGRASGLGLGLAIVRWLVEAHGGTIAVSSAGVGRGTTFTIRLPRASDTDLTSLRSHEREVTGVHPVPGMSSLEGVLVLVVDRDRDAREVAKAILTAEGAEVGTAGSVDEALAWIVGRQLDVLLAETSLAIEDGFFQHVRRRHPSISGIAIGRSSRSRDIRRAIAQGFLRHLVAPVDARTLVEAVVAVAPIGDLD
jgi:CheY-like chemotaxis protein/anti-sigma regulatory factor (Ser/Thr protein kinase)